MIWVNCDATTGKMLSIFITWESIFKMNDEIFQRSKDIPRSVRFGWAPKRKNQVHMRVGENVPAMGGGEDKTSPKQVKSRPSVLTLVNIT